MELEELKIKYENISRELLSRTDKLVETYKENNELKEKFNKIKEFIKISEQPKYKRQPCINCEYKLICAGECDKTLKREVSK